MFESVTTTPDPENAKMLKAAFGLDVIRCASNPDADMEGEDASELIAAAKKAILDYLK